MIYLIPLFLLLTSCKQSDTKPDLVTPSPIISQYKADWDHVAGSSEWTKTVLTWLDKNGTQVMTMDAPKDADKYCPQFQGFTLDERKQVFLMLISSMARFESSFKPETKYQESFKGPDGKYVVSRGLLQLSQTSANQKAYGCNFKSAEEVHDANKNLECGLKILGHWLVKDRYFGSGKLGGARYWAVLRDHSDSQDKIRTKVRAFCSTL